MKPSRDFDNMTLDQLMELEAAGDSEAGEAIVGAFAQGLEQAVKPVEPSRDRQVEAFHRSLSRVDAALGIPVTEPGALAGLVKPLDDLRQKVEPAAERALDLLEAMNASRESIETISPQEMESATEHLMNGLGLYGEPETEEDRQAMRTLARGAWSGQAPAGFFEGKLREHTRTTRSPCPARSRVRVPRPRERRSCRRPARRTTASSSGGGDPPDLDGESDLTRAGRVS